MSRKACPSNIELSAYLDHRLRGQSRKRLVAHLADCETCCRILVESGRFLDEADALGTPAQARPSRRPRVWAFAAVPLAAAVVVILAVALVPLLEDRNPVHTGPARPAPAMTVLPGAVGVPPAAVRPAAPESTAKPSLDSPGPFACSALVERLSLSPKARLVFPLGEGSRPAGLGFSPEASREVASFRLGAALVDLEAAFTTGDRSLGRKALQRAADEASRFSPPAELGRQFSDVRNRLERGESTGNFRRFGDRVAAVLADRCDQAFLEFGQWVEGGRIAVRLGDVDYPRATDINHFLRRLGARAVPSGVRQALEELAGLVSPMPASRDRNRIGRAFETLADVLE